MDKNIHKGHRARLRSMASRNGISNLQEHQVLELLLTYVIPQKDVNPLAHQLINKFGSFSNVLNAKTSELTTVKGIGETTAMFLTSMKEFFYVYKEKSRVIKTVIKNTEDAFEHCKGLLGHLDHEELYVLCIDGGNNLKKTEKISKGTVNFTDLNIRKLTEVVFSSNTHNVIICHNHPTGKSTPSQSDHKLTKSVLMALTLNNINLLDHIIIGQNDYFSYSVSGVLGQMQEEIKDIISTHIVMQDKCEYN